ncbi:MAG: hypothetical protein CFH05_00655 [Alphaproteobacteria bacterium MarineAlpha3_Bin4]|nr:MAG: hypothetical protein CFH05_00655 [Alphaproteobacteria bacterium MarineAlpha3_Bin4]
MQENILWHYSSQTAYFRHVTPEAMLSLILNSYQWQYHFQYTDG